jgi:hypothetical protein
MPISFVYELFQEYFSCLHIDNIYIYLSCMYVYLIDIMTHMFTLNIFNTLISIEVDNLETYICITYSCF